jgi:hypothetical protein
VTSSTLTLLVAASESSKVTGPLGGHLWHVVEASVFLVGSLGGIWFSEVVHRRRSAAGPRWYASPSAAGAGGSTIAIHAGFPAVTREPRDMWRSALLPLVGIGTAAAASVHFVVMPHHFEEGTIYGVFFAATATLQVAFALLVLMRPSRPLLAVGLFANFAVVVLWLFTRTVGIPLGPDAGGTEAVGGLDILATAFELTVVGASAMLLWRKAPFRAALHPSGWAPGIWVFLVGAVGAVVSTTLVWPPS